MSTESQEQSQQSTVLIFDDDTDYLNEMKRGLEAHGYLVLEACSSEEVETVIAQQRPDLVVAGLMMEHDDTGFTLCYRIKKRYPDLPIIMVTGVAHATGFKFAAATGEERRWLKADVVLDKPVRYEQLEREIRRLL